MPWHPALHFRVLCRTREPAASTWSADLRALPQDTMLMAHGLLHDIALGSSNCTVRWGNFLGNGRNANQCATAKQHNAVLQARARRARCANKPVRNERGGVRIA